VSGEQAGVWLLAKKIEATNAYQLTSWMNSNISNSVRTRNLQVRLCIKGVRSEFSSARNNVTGAFAWIWYWRESTHDGIYAYGREALIDPGDASRARYLGNQGDLEIRWAPAPHIILLSTSPALSQGLFSRRLPTMPGQSPRTSALPIASRRAGELRSEDHQLYLLGRQRQPD
jgi:hypothetical protein